MPVPKKRLSATRQGNRRSHLSLSVTKSTTCSNCGAVIATHRVCQNCGFYRGARAIPERVNKTASAK